MRKYLYLTPLVIGLLSCASKKEPAPTESALVSLSNLDEELKRIDSYVEFENSNPSILKSPTRSPAGTPEIPGTPALPPGTVTPSHGTGLIFSPTRPLEAFAVCNPPLEQIPFGAFPMNSIYGRQLAYPSIANALLSLALPSASVSGDQYWDRAMVASSLGQNAWPGSDLDLAAKANPLFSHAFDFAQGRIAHPSTPALAILTTSLIRTAKNSECQRQVIERAKVAFQGRTDINWMQIEALIAKIRSDVLTGRAATIYNDLSQRRASLQKSLEEIKKYRDQRNKNLVATLKQEVSRSKSCRANMRFLQMTGELEGLNSREQILTLRESIALCLRRVENRLAGSESLPPHTRKFKEEDGFIAEKEILQNSLFILQRLENALVNTNSEMSPVDDRRLQEDLRQVDAEWVAYYFLLGMGS